MLGTEKLSNKLSLVDSQFTMLPLGTVTPRGWLKNQLEIQRDGFTGHLDEHWEDVGPNNGWLGGNGDSWERGPYYLDGLVPLAYILEDERLIQKVEPWIEWTLASQREDGSFGPHHVKTVNKEIHNQDWWQDMIMLKVLTQYQEATNDERVIPFITRYFQFLRHKLTELPLVEWAEARGAELLLTIHWLYERTENEELLELAEIVRKQTINWSKIFDKFPYWRKQTQWDHRIHVVNVAMGIKTPAVFYRQSGEEWEKEAVYKGIESLMTYHGQAHGMFSGDEWLSGTHPSQGVELCAVVEYMFSMEQLVKIFGDGMFADILDKIAFNALPATISPDWDSHQYDQQANQIMCNVANRPWSNGPDANTFGLAPHFGCCTANMHQGWPKFAGSLWMGTRDNGLAAISYAPCHVQTKVADTEIELHVDSAYPFRENVTITITVSKEVQLPILLRVPRWCPDMKIKVNGQQQTYTIENGFARIERQWQDQDQIELDLPMEVNVTERNNYAASIERGPLVYALPLGEQWVQTHERERFHDWEIYPKSNWRYGLVTDGEFRLSKGEIAYQPFKADNPPVKLQVNGKIVSNWGMENNSAAEPPINPKTHPDAKTETLELIPYGSARLRITEFPVLEE